MVCVIIYILLIFYGLCFALTFDDPQPMLLGARFLTALALEGAFAVGMAVLVGLGALGSWIYDHCPFGR